MSSPRTSYSEHTIGEKIVMVLTHTTLPLASEERLDALLFTMLILSGINHRIYFDAERAERETPNLSDGV